MKLNSLFKSADRLADSAGSLRRAGGMIDLSTDALKKSGDNLADAAKRSGDNLADAARRSGDNLADAARRSGDDLADASKRSGDDLGDAAKKSEPSSKVSDDALNTPKETFMKKYGNAMIYGTVAISVAAVVAASQIKADKINNTTYTIISIRPDNVDKNKTIIAYTPNDSFSNHDAVSISGTNSIPSIDGDGYSIEKVAGGIIKIGKKITGIGSSGTLKCTTTFSNQMSENIKDIGGVVLSPATDIAGNLLSDILPKWVTTGFTQFWWVSLIFIVMMMFLSMSIILR